MTTKEIANKIIEDLKTNYNTENFSFSVDDDDYATLWINNEETDEKLGYFIYPDVNIEYIVSYISANQNFEPKAVSSEDEDDKLHDLGYVDRRKRPYLYGDDDPGFDDYDTVEEGITNVSNVVTTANKMSEDLDTDNMPESLANDYPSLLVAIDSEKDAEITYKTLIDIEKSSTNPNQQVIDLLEKILKEELQHIALLSALSASKNSEFVEEDSKEDFNDYIEDMKQ